MCDRFTDATYAYQGFGRGIDQQRIGALEAWVQGELRPDYVLLFDLDVATGMARAHARGRADRFEQEHSTFFEKIRAGYLQRAARHPELYPIINAALALDEVQAQLQIVIERIIQQVDAALS